MAAVLIRDAEIWGFGPAHIRLSEGRIEEIGDLVPHPGETMLEAYGGALLPGLHDHHIHLAALAARAASIACGPPEVETRDDLLAALTRPGKDWLRGIGYHESVVGLPTARELDALVADRPLRIQHRSGRLWLLNTAALDDLLSRAPAPPGLDRATGHLFEEDDWLREALGSMPPDFSAVSAELASYGVTGLTDMSPRNDPAMAAHFAAQMQGGALVQRCRLAGSLALTGAAGPWQLGEAKLHLHEAAFPPFDEAIAFISQAHDQGRALAIHCVSEVELVFALAALEEAGVAPGDRIEHASVADEGHVARIAALGLAVVTQPHFLAERGDRYLLDVEPRHHGDLYRLASFKTAGITLAGGSDAPFGGANPWQAMRAAVSRETRGGAVITPAEALSPEEALALYLADPQDLTRHRRIAPGEPADLCLLDRPWAQARGRLSSADVRATFVGGGGVYERVDQAPV
jgi:predicted amidohydrolase YtcJ